MSFLLALYVNAKLAKAETSLFKTSEYFLPNSFIFDSHST